MQEKDIREKLNQELEEMAPDLLSKIISQPIEPIKNEKELLGKNKTLFKEKKRTSQFTWVTAMVACIAVIILVTVWFQTNSGNEQQQEQNTHIIQNKMAFCVTIDVNPSISIEVNKEGKVMSVTAKNEDAKKIAESVNEKIDDNTDYNRAVKLVIDKLNKEGYFKKKDKAMLISVISDNRDNMKETLRDIRNNTNEYQQENGIKSKTVYQRLTETEEIKQVAEKNNVSIGKAAFCMQIAEKKNVSVKKMCKKSIDSLVDEAEKAGTVEEEEVVIISEQESVNETESESVEETTIEEVGTEEDTDIEDITIPSETDEEENVSDVVDVPEESVESEINE